MDEIEIDQQCQGQWSDGKWYPCKVVKYQDGKYEVEWEDGDTRFCSLVRERLKPLFDDCVQCDKCNAWRDIPEGMPCPGSGEEFLCENVGMKCQRIKRKARLIDFGVRVVKIHPADRQKSDIFHEVVVRYDPTYKKRHQTSFREALLKSRNSEKQSKDCDSKSPMEEEDMDEEHVWEKNMQKWSDEGPSGVAEKVQKSPDEDPSGVAGEVETNKNEVVDLTNDSDEDEKMDVVDLTGADSD